MNSSVQTPVSKDRVSHIGSAVVASALFAFILFCFVGPRLVPFPRAQMDSENFEHFAATNFTYASSPLDQSVMSPFQGLGGLCQPMTVWLHPGYLLQHWMGAAESRAWPTVVSMFLLGLSTYALSRAMRLSVLAAIVVAQAVAMFSFYPFYDWLLPITHLNGAHLYPMVPGIALPAILGNFFLSLFISLGTLSRRGNIACAAMLPVILIYTVLIDPLYTALFFLPVGLICGGVFFGSQTRDVFVWRTGGGAFCMLVLLLAGIPQFYRGLVGYAARGVFPNELYVEIQQWDYNTALLFQGGLGTWAVIAVLLACSVACWLGSAQVRGFCAAVIACIVGLAVVSLIYVYSGLRWNQPVPSYLEAGAHAAYAVSAVLGLSLGARTLARKRALKLPGCLVGPLRPVFCWGAALALPVCGLLTVLIAARTHADEYARARAAAEQRLKKPQGGIVREFLEPQLAIGTDGRFRGSVANLVGAPGGGLMRRMQPPVPESAPFTKDLLVFDQHYIRSFDSNLFMTGLWNCRIPTLEDNNHLVTPPFHFLVSRLLSRPQDYHSRNWAVLTAARPRLMAALGCRFLLTDDPQVHSALALKAKQTNADGITIYAYEIQRVNLGQFSPTQTVLSTDARETLGLLGDEAFAFESVAVVHDKVIYGLTSAEAGEIAYEQGGGVRVRARSNGLALLVLPVQFSNSLQIVSTALNKKATPIQLLRVNLLQTGVLFDGEIDFKFAHIFGPLRSTAGRLRDIEDCRRLGIKETGEIPYPSNYQPLTWRGIGAKK